MSVSLQELRMVLQEHDWNVEDALQVLQMFSDPGVNKAAIFSLWPHVYVYLYLLCGFILIPLQAHIVFCLSFVR